jgi:hypothetical protein
MSNGRNWVEYRCPKCRRTLNAPSGESGFCWGEGKTRHAKTSMSEGLLGETQALMRNRLVGRKVRTA